MTPKADRTADFAVSTCRENPESRHSQTSSKPSVCTKTTKKTSGKTVLGSRSSADYSTTEEISVGNGQRTTINAETRKVNGVRDHHSKLTAHSKTIGLTVLTTSKDSRSDLTGSAKLNKTRGQKSSHHSPRIKTDSDLVNERIQQTSPSPNADSRQNASTTRIVRISAEDGGSKLSFQHEKMASKPAALSLTDHESSDAVGSRKKKRSFVLASNISHSDKETSSKTKKTVGGAKRKTSETSSDSTSRKPSEEPTLARQDEARSPIEAQLSGEADRYGSNEADIKAEMVNSSSMSPLLIVTSGLRAMWVFSSTECSNLFMFEIFLYLLGLSSLYRFHLHLIWPLDLLPVSSTRLRKVIRDELISFFQAL